MDIKTKFRLGQNVYFMLNDKPCFGVIEKIEITIKKSEIDIIYTLGSNYGIIEAVENCLFNSKEELKNNKLND